MIDIKAIRAEMATIHAAASEYEATYATTDATEEQQAEQAERFAKLERMAQQIESAEKLAKYAISGDKPAGVETPRPVAHLPRKWADQIAVEAAEAVANTPATFNREDFSRALTDWALTGVMADEYATITTATSSGALYPKQVGLPVVTAQGSALREAMAAVGVQPVTTESTADMNLPVISIAVGSDVSETATSGTDNSPVPPVINLKPVPTQSGQAWVSNLELGSLDYDLTAEIVPALADAKEMRLEQRAMVAIIADAGITQTVATAATTGFTYANLVDLNRKLSRRYDRQKVIFLSDTAYAAAEKLVGDDGHPVLNRDPQNQSLLRFNGTPVIRSSYLEAFGASKIVGLIVSFVGFKVRDAGQPKLVRHVDDKDKVDQTGLNMIGYHAVGYVPDAVASLKTPAS